jgi:hypothetical protein
MTRIPDHEEPMVFVRHIGEAAAVDKDIVKIYTFPELSRRSFHGPNLSPLHSVARIWPIIKFQPRRTLSSECQSFLGFFAGL